MAVQVIDCTPSWEGLLPMLIDFVENGTAANRQIAKEELLRMARSADKYVEIKKSQETTDVKL